MCIRDRSTTDKENNWKTSHRYRINATFYWLSVTYEIQDCYNFTSVKMFEMISYVFKILIIGLKSKRMQCYTEDEIS